MGERLRHVSFPGFEEVPLYDAFWFFFNGVQRGGLNTRATAIAFNFMLALGPGVIFLLTLIPYLPIENFQQELLDVFNSIMPENSYIAIESLMQEIFHKRGGLPFFGLLVSLFFAQKGINGIIAAFNSTHHVLESRPWFRQRLVAVALVFIVYALIIVAALLMFFTKTLFENLHSSGYIKVNSTYYLMIYGKWLMIIALTFCCISFLYYLAPAKRGSWRFFSVGSSLATVLTVIASLGFSYFVNHFAQFNKFFGSIGALMALMLWFNFNALTLLVGFELNASVHIADRNLQEQ